MTVDTQIPSSSVTVDTESIPSMAQYIGVEGEHTMYKPCYCKDGKTLKHSDECTMAFGHKDVNCPRCAELLAGAAPRLRFGGRKTSAEIDAQRCIEIRYHFASAKHLSGGCGPVCTFGEW